MEALLTTAGLGGLAVIAWTVTRVRAHTTPNNATALAAAVVA